MMVENLHFSIPDKLLYDLIGAELKVLVINPKRYRGLSYLTKIKKSKLSVLSNNPSLSHIVKEVGGEFILGGRIDSLKLIKNKEFDIVVLDEGLFFHDDTELFMQEIVRIGKHCIFTIPNKATIFDRIRFLFTGRILSSEEFEKQKFRSGLNVCSVDEFTELCERNKIIIEKGCFSDNKMNMYNLYDLIRFPTLFGKKFFFIVRSVLK